MAEKYYLDFVGLNTLIYEPVGYDPPNQINETAYGIYVTPEKEMMSNGGTSMVLQNQRGLFVYNSGNRLALRFYKNYRFSHSLPNTASFFPALMLHRNGPYGWPSWKQTRVGQNPLTRKQVKNNIFTHVEEPGSSIVIQGAQVNRRYGDIKAFVETPVISRYRPVMIRGASSVISERSGRTTLERFTINSSFGNSLVHFNNEELDKYYNFIDQSDDAYDEIKQLYLEDGLNSPDSPMDIFEFVRYSETIYPTQLYTNKSYTRQRTNFVFNWRDDFENRKSVASTIENGTNTNGFGAVFYGSLGQPMSQSIWPLDFDVAQGESGGSDRFVNSYGLNVSASFSNGILMNNYNQTSNFSGTGYATLNAHLMPAPIYARKHMLTPSASVVSKNGMTIETVNSGTTADLQDKIDLPSGEAKWEAGDQAGKNPFYDSYDDYVQGVRQRGKGYTIVPEFRISNHIPTIVAEGVGKNFSNMFEMTGGLSSTDGSDEENFYKVYSTSEFLRHFDLVKEDHKDFVEPTRIKLKCKAIKKFLPYNGFYPCQRTVEIGQQFYSSYGNSIAVDGASAFGLGSLARIGKKNILNPLFGPGVLFNTIKAGVACDYPVITGSAVTKEDGDDYYLVGRPANNTNKIFEKRVPFKAIVEPERFLAGVRIRDQEPHPSASTSTSAMWDGTGDNLYKMVAHNFLAEVPSFFLQGQQFSTINSLPSDDPRVGNAISGTVYSMRVKMFKTSDDTQNPIESVSGGEYFYAPQYEKEARENFTMYSRPTAFGPPSQTTSSHGFENMTGSNSEIGENYPFTPPYYYGQAWADIKFRADETKKYTINEIIANSNVTYWRFVDDEMGTGTYSPTARTTRISDLYNNDAMQLNASVNLFALGEIKAVDVADDEISNKVNMVVDINNKEKASWIIQPLFETPMLNFNHLSASTSLHLPTHGSQSVPRGMWHQYGRIETDIKKGIFLQTTNIPTNFRKLVSGSVDEQSLMELCGFKDEPKRLGQIAQSKVISEAVVAIPFIEEEGQRKFFKLDRSVVDMAKQELSMLEANLGDSVEHMVKMMKKFVIPPSFDFVHRQDIDPFAMYIFEFNHTLNQQDLADIWQNLPPSIGRSFEEATATISHPLLASELLSEGILEDGKKTKGNPLPDKIRWLVFKAKQRAETNYYDKVVGERDLKQNTSAIQKARQNKLIDDASSILRPEGYGTNVSYNWPYDFFSLVELVKIDAEVTLSDSDALLKEEDNIVIKRGVRGIAGLPARAQQRIQRRNNEEDDDSQTNVQRTGPFR